ncbi:MAG TPA: hypothetical protein DCQ64_29615 [Candidatus Rokubacteria bacterium]|nr:hypothetical protein [Candidatus Rokubacteria bacterium]
MTITFRIHARDLGTIGLTLDDCDRYADQLLVELGTRYPAAKVEVQVNHRDSGAGAGVRVEANADEDCDEGAVTADVRELADQVLTRMVEA